MKSHRAVRLFYKRRSWLLVPPVIFLIVCTWSEVENEWIVFGFGIAVGGTFLEELPAMINPIFMDTAYPEGVVYHLVSVASFVLFLLGIPITLGFSIRRNRLWDIDFIVNRSLVYGTATFLLALVFVGIFFLLQFLFEGLTGGQRSTLAVVASTLTITGLFQPVRSRLQTFIDRNLYGIQIGGSGESSGIATTLL